MKRIWQMGLIGLVLVVCGCSTIKDWIGGGEDWVEVHPESRKYEWHGALNTAQDRLGMKMRLRSVAYFVPATHYPNGKAAIVRPIAGDLVGGWTTCNGKRTLTKMAMYPDGHLGPRTINHEAGRAVLYSNDINDPREQERRLKEAGLW